jgi:hypothetical protein
LEDERNTKSVGKSKIAILYFRKLCEITRTLADNLQKLRVVSFISVGFGHYLSHVCIILFCLTCELVRVLQRNRTNREREREWIDMWMDRRRLREILKEMIV